MPSGPNTDTNINTDEDFVYASVYNEFWYLIYLSCNYLDLRSGHRRGITIVYCSIMTFMAGYMLWIFPMTAFKMTEDILVASQGIHFFLLEVICISGAISSNTQRTSFAFILKHIGTGPVEYDEETRLGTKHMRAKMQSRKKYLLLGVAVYICFAGFLTVVLAPFIDNVVNGWPEKKTYSSGGVSLNLPVPLWSPFGTHTTATFLLSLTLEMMSAFEITIMVIGLDLLIIAWPLYVAMELQVLTWALKRMPERAIRMYQNTSHEGERKHIKISDLTKNKKLLDCYQQCLRETAQHYQKIIMVFQKVNSILSFPVFIGFFCGSMVIALSGVAMLFGNATVGSLITAFVLGFGEILNMLLNAWCGEQVSGANEKFLEALYSTKWYYTSKRETKTLQIIMCRAQRPMVLLAGGMVPFSFGTFTDVMNSAYSYFNLVYATHNKNR